MKIILMLIISLNVTAKEPFDYVKLCDAIGDYYNKRSIERHDQCVKESKKQKLLYEKYKKSFTSEQKKLIESVNYIPIYRNDNGESCNLVKDWTSTYHSQCMEFFIRGIVNRGYFE